WSAAAAALVVGAALFPITAGRAKILDRMSPTAPHSLDGMAFMTTSSYTFGLDNQPATTWDLNQDYQAIQWMQDHVQGSPVIVEGHTTEYRWENRFSMFTGLPGVVGYQWHEEQQRSTFGTDPVSPRVAEVDTFYNTPDLPYTQAFLKKYNVRYIIVGQLEEAMYPQSGLAKFAAQDGVLWKQVFHSGATSIYEVQPVGLASSPG
ncbi:MAG TPA: hypothetical protein VF813_07610, partial [Anaerolineaceae bacterium]